MNDLPIIDLFIIFLYLVAMILVGVWFSRKNKNAEQFTKASGMIPGWAVGISLYATFLSSNTFLGVPGKAFGSDWSPFVFSLSMPLAAWVAVKYFVPFYRSSGNVSAYSHLEERFGPWARTYTMICFLLTQLARMGSIFFGIALSLQALTGYDMVTIMIVMGICIVIYTVLGGMEAVIWTEVFQAILLTFGALFILYLLLTNVDGGTKSILAIGIQDKKFSLGSFDADLIGPSFWVILLYGFFINLNNFGMDQNYVQRYHTASSAKEAAKSIWLCVKLYIPVSLLFFVIGTGLYAYYQQSPELTSLVRHQAAIELLPSSASDDEVSALASILKPNEYGDKIMPHFMATMIPTGLAGLVISAILAAAMSTISSGMNASATVFTEDIYKRYIRPKSTNKQTLRILFLSTAFFGLLGIITGITMIGVQSILDLWWELSGIFAGGMLGLFLLGLISKRTGNSEAIAATVIGVMIIIWMTFTYLIPDQYSFIKYPLHANMIIVVGTLTIFLSGTLITRIKLAWNNSQ
jgi:SSS family solute:Na+ symporter